MKEYPIIMSGNHPKLVLDGLKTMTRRTWGLDKYNEQPDKWKIGAVMANDTVLFWSASCDSSYSHKIKCPHGGVGDRLWVRETFCLENTYEYHEDCLAPKDRPYQRCGDNDFGHYFLIPHYKATEPDVLITDGENEKGEIKTLWKPSIHMPRWASRITLEITELWAELLRSISPADAMAEGGYTVEEFIKLYLKINHLPDDANPWNFAIKFKLLDVGNKFLL